MITHVIVELKYPVEDEYFLMDTVFPNEYYGYGTPLIRCKDCRWYDTTDSSGTVEPIGYRCREVNRLWREPDDFCKRAERKEERGE